jgi:hypothetical protein
MSTARTLTSLAAAALVTFAMSLPLPAMAYVWGNGHGLQGINMQGMNMQGVNMQGVNLQGDQHQGLNFQGEQGQGVFLQGVSTKALADYPRGFEIIGIELPD